MKHLIILITLLLTCSCLTNVVRPMKSDFAPVGYKPKGTIKYLANGADFIISGRREDAFREMYRACNGKYSINSEILGYEYSSQYIFINYQCEG